MIISGILFFTLLLLPVCAEERSKSEKVIASKNQKNEAVQTLQKKDEALETFDKLIWETDMDHAFERAKKEHRNVMVMVEDIRCKWCKNMKIGALSDARVQEKLQSYILLKVQRSDKETSKRIVDFAGAIPSFYFMEPNQEIYESMVGYFAIEDFLSYLIEIEEDN